DGRNGVHVVYWDREFNYSAINNFGIRHAKGEYILCMNNDMEVISPDWMTELLGHCQRPGTGIVGARLYYPDDTIQHAGIVIGIGGIAGSVFVGLKRGHTGYMHRESLQQDLSAVTAACMMVKREAYDAAGGFEEKLAIAFNDVDFCLKVCEAGYLVAYDPYAELYHYESKTRGPEDTEAKARRFQDEIEYMRTRWIRILKDGDPYYNRNLSLSKWNYSLRSL
ncbi:MAG: glycosyltransferase, partial [Clostridiales bacterium]|nr:glycosyltransferase [Clostridiales bacterium]